ncbi:transcription factor MYB15-like [Solanum dulcamara]|uniref:transcription factor MYB15-like n=1 Tax=Solanum dulcamara TaxID=45834 RepID=UPI00248650CB|nr:transcription factor MYB15-like [Solanum dulcamara]XP_055804145.1 transcription factor MYB15-like [Solanum dulcamara]XP_055804146.1 transcription factor MYB15-like [Solanum dulcamara]XP_055804147.1 transcription factor MYB15-like [Solanum dulcamara]
MDELSLPCVKRGPFTIEEVKIVIKIYQELGNRWSAIAGRLSARTDNQIKNLFHTHLKKHLGVKTDALMKRRKRIFVKKAKENEMKNNIDADKPSPDVCNSSEKSNMTIVTWEEKQTRDIVSINAVVDEAADMEVRRPVTLEGYPEIETNNLGCHLYQFEYPQPCTISDFDFFHQFDVLF